jgi:hypothetical protein
MFGQEHAEDDEAYVLAPWEIMRWKEFGIFLDTASAFAWKGWVAWVAGAQDRINFKYLQTQLSARSYRRVS